MMDHTNLHIEVVVNEALGQETTAWFEELILTDLPSGGTRLAGLVPDQTAVHGILGRIRDLNLTLVSVQVTNN